MGPLQRSFLLLILYCLYAAGLGSLGFIGPMSRYADGSRLLTTETTSRRTCSAHRGSRSPLCTGSRRGVPHGDR
jgi:hypothetical protein